MGGKSHSGKYLLLKRKGLRRFQNEQPAYLAMRKISEATSLNAGCRSAVVAA